MKLKKISMKIFKNPIIMNKNEKRKKKKGPGPRVAHTFGPYLFFLIFLEELIINFFLIICLLIIF